MLFIMESQAVKAETNTGLLDLRHNNIPWGVSAKIHEGTERIKVAGNLSF